jgi:hypothetical protein
MNLNEWVKVKEESYRLAAKEAMLAGDDVVADSILSEEHIQEIKAEIEIETFCEEVDFEDEIDLTEAYLDMDQNKDECDCPDDADGCECPEMYFDFLPDKYADMMDIEIETTDHYDAGIENYLRIRDSIFADDMDVIEADLPEEALSEDDPLEYGVTPMGEAGRARVVFRRAKGRIVKRKRCPAGSRLKGFRCVPQSGTQKAGNRRLGIKLKRAQRARGAGDKKRAALRGRITKKRVAGRSRNYSGT